MKRLLLLLLVFMGSFAFAQDMKPQWTKILNGSPETFQTQLVSSSDQSIVVNVQVPGFFTTTVSTPRGEAKIITVPRAVSTAEAGEPDVPMIGIPAVIGDRSRMNVRVLNAQYMDFEGIEIAPSKGQISRQVDPNSVPYTYGECYSTDAFFPAKNVGMYEPYILRDFRGQNMTVKPFAYNPVTKTLRVYYDITVEMYQDGFGGANMVENRSSVMKLDPEFKSVYANHFINFEDASSKYSPVDEEGDLLIICYDNFVSYMTDFVNWKKTRGVNTTIVKKSTAGSSYSAIYNYIKSQYNANNNLAHVLLVGDVAQIPGYSYSGGGSSYAGLGDNAYGQVVGSDYYNDIFIGRFSAQTAAQVTTQVNRSIYYERDLTTSDTWLNKADGIGRKEGAAGHNNEDDYQHIDNIRTDLLNWGYSTVYQDYENLSGYTGTASSISSHVNGGVGIINYCNHGNNQLWGVAYYSNTHVNQLTNSNKLPFIWSVACLVGKYDNTETSYGSNYTIGQNNDCFAEAWMHATYSSSNLTPTGAIGGAFSYISQPWLPPMYAQDEMVDILVESYSSNIKHTLAGTSVNGMMKMFDQYGTSGTNGQASVGTYQAWVIYGDPSLMLRTKTPQAMNVTHNGSIDATATTYVVNVSNGNGALATITNANHDILGKATVSNGKATITLTAPGNTTEDLTLCVFGYNKVTYLGTITVGGTAATYYTVSATASPTAGGTISGTGSYAENSTATLVATPAAGYQFSKWTKNGTQVSTNATYSFTVTGNTSLVANFAKKSYTITASANPSNGGTVSGAGTFEYGNSCTLVAQATGDYHFVNWTKNGIAVSTNESYTFTVTEAGAYVANFSDSQTSDVTIGSGTSYNQYLPTYAYYNYSLTEQIYTPSEIGEAGTITAIAFKVSNSKSTTRNVDVYMKHTTKSAFTSRTGWESLSSSNKVYSGNVTFSASGWTTITLDTPFVYDGTNNLVIGMDDNTGSYVSSSSNSPRFYVYSTGANRAMRIYSDNTNYNPASPTSYSGTYITSNNQIMLTKSFSGGTTVNEYDITATASPAAGGTVTGAGTYEEGDNVTLTAVANTGYTFSKWTKNGTQVSTSATYSFTASADAAYVAVFTLKSYNVTATANPTAGGTITGTGTYNHGATATLQATAKSGYEFTNWTQNGTVVSTSANISFTVNGAVTLVANFAEEVVTTYYDITVAAVSNGTVTANKTSAAEGETVTLTATPANGCAFSQWLVYRTGDVNSTLTVSNSRFTMPACDVTVAAVFTASAGTGTGTGSTETLTLGSGTSYNSYLPTYAYYKYSLSEQIYTAAEIGQAGTITAIAFKVSNSKSTTRSVDLYMKHTTKSAFSSKTGWETLASSYKVFSGNVTFSSSGWTTITLDTPFEYDGSSNLVVGMDDNTGSYVSSSSNSPRFYVYATGANRALRIYNDGTNYNPASPSSYSGTYVTSNNQIQLTMTTAGTGSTEVAETLFATPSTLSGFTYVYGNGPSEVQSFAVVGANLNGPVTVTAPSNYEICATENGTYGSTLTLTGNRNRDTQTWGFEGSFDGWSTIDADGDGYIWQQSSVLMSGYAVSAHGGSDMLSSESYNRSAGALTPDNWLVSPLVTLGGSFTMYACAQDANYAAEHFGIFVSTTSSTNTNSFTKLNEWTLSAKGDRAQGSWNAYTVDLSAFAGQTGYIAVRHYNCTDQFYLNVDDFTLTYSSSSVTPVDPGTDPSTPIDFLAANVYVRLKAGQSQGTYNKTLSMTTGNTTAYVSLNGTVTGRNRVEEIADDQKAIDVYPNPAERGAVVHFDLPSELRLDEAKVEVFNALGVMVHAEALVGNEVRSDFAAGVYTIRVTSANGEVYYSKLVVR
ncbi:MAG: choice-of-anchor J domain-containing protein [Bacteroidales bacterium]|nr:choice-of-anchor J domain-containing protein [Bacteroidales bacterium]